MSILQAIFEGISQNTVVFGNYHLINTRKCSITANYFAVHGSNTVTGPLRENPFSFENH